MSDAFFAFVKTTWQKTDGEKAVFWRAYGWIILISLGVCALPIVLLIAYVHFFTTPETSTNALPIVIVGSLAIIAFIGAFYWMILASALPYFVLRFLRQDEGGNSFSIAAKKALVHKGAIFINWILFLIIFNFLHNFLKHIIACDTCFLLRMFIFSAMTLILNIAILEILENNESAFVAFANAWKLFARHWVMCVETMIWILALSLFSVITLFIGSIWALPAKNNAIALLYERIRR